jgi:hypothetical protein
MSRPCRLLRICASAVSVLVVGTASAAAAPALTTTAWQNGSFVVDVPNLVRRSNIVLARPNLAPTQFMALGNGTLGAAVWAANGFTAQLNRIDTFPDRRSRGPLTSHRRWSPRSPRSSATPRAWPRSTRAS